MAVMSFILLIAAAVMAAPNEQALVTADEEVRTLLHLVLADEVRRPRDTGQTCISPTTSEWTFASDRARLRPQGLWVEYKWTSVAPRAEDERELSPAEAGVLSKAVRPLILSEPGPDTPLALEAGGLPQGYRWSERRPDCAILSLATPAIAGNLAFVQTSYSCGGLCGRGYLYALRREGAHWRIAGRSFTWAS